MVILRLLLSNRDNKSGKVLLGIEIQFKGKLLHGLKAGILLHEKILRCTEYIFSWHETITFLVEN